MRYDKEKFNSLYKELRDELSDKTLECALSKLREFRIELLEQKVSEEEVQSINIFIAFECLLIKRKSGTCSKEEVDDFIIFFTTNR
ncbi:MAG: hypothetical protein K0R15_1068 [Clostridiales bacterium]|nr:hypothetical protein [Clostridiales bacterium]MDF2948869.1 hypothetical protein [Sedimentibacter sp.]